jgi:hypothetical protein
VSVCIDGVLSALLWPGTILLIRLSWPYVIHHLHFMNMYRLYIAWYRPILLMYVGCINWYFRNKTLFYSLISNIVPGQSSALRTPSIQTLTEIKL